jgi:hypothetical protein
MPKILSNADKIVFAPKPYYYYNCTNKNSITATPMNAKVKYGFFASWAEHERISKVAFEKAYKISQSKAIVYAIRSLCINKVKPSLSQDEINRCKEYLAAKKSGDISAKVSRRYKILWWGLNYLPVICKLFGYYTLFQRYMKRKIRKSGKGD